MSKDDARVPASDPADDERPKPDADRRIAGFEQHTRRPFLIGVYLATNGISDAVTIVDGPDCAFFKAEFIHGKHDLGSTLLDVTGRHRILVSHITTDDVAKSQGARASALIHKAASMPEINLVLVTSLPMVSIIGTQYDQLVRDLRSQVAAELCELPGRSLQGDWLAGYEDVLLALAQRIEAPAEGLRDDSVSIVGNFMDRNEEDHRGNLRELGRLVEALGLRLDATWLSGRPWNELRQAGRSGTLLALPLGRQAARVIAETTGAQVVDVAAPFGLQGTTSFLDALGAATDRVERARSLIEGELREMLPRLEWVVPHVFLGKRVAFTATPDLLVGFHELASELGMEVIGLSSTARRPVWFEHETIGGLEPQFDETFEGVHRRLNESPAGPAQLIVGTSETIRQAPSQSATVEFGYPSYVDHALFDRPFLGYRGYLAFVQRMATALAVHQSRRRR